MNREPENILVIDDEESTCKFFQVILSKEGYNIKTVLSGEEALELLKHENFSCILCDVVMPKMDGNMRF